jgi:hypothetical protein
VKMSGLNEAAISQELSISFIFFSAPAWAEDSRRTFFKVNNLSCGVCIGKINAKLKTFEGYIRMMANIDKGLVAVDHMLCDWHCLPDHLDCYGHGYARLGMANAQQVL